MVPDSQIYNIQRVVHVSEDGEWGPQTQEALRDCAILVTEVRALLKSEGRSQKVLDRVFGSRLFTAPKSPVKVAPVAPWPKPPAPIVGSAKDAERRMVVAVAKACVGWKEKTGRNDGTEIDRILAACGLQGTKNPYCACFNVFVGDQAFGRAKNPYPRSAWSPDMVKKPTWTKAKGGRTPRAGDTFGIYFSSKGRVAHTGIIIEWHADKGYAITIEGNTSGSNAYGTEADRNGDGVFMKKRQISEIYAVQDWIGD